MPLRTVIPLALALALTCLLGAAAAPARAAEPGLVPDLNWGTSVADQQRTAAAIEDLGARWVRLSVQWSYWEPNGPITPGVADNGSRWETDRAVRLAREAGAKVLIVVYNAPGWAAAGSSGEGSTPRNPADYAAFMARLARHYRGQVSAYEVWNEPDLDRFWAGGPNPAAYASLLKASYPAIKAADPGAKVVFGGLSWDYTHFLGRAYAAGVKGSFDVLGVHPYQSSAPGPGWRAWYGTARETMRRNGDDKPVWFTEWGYNTSTVVKVQGTGDWQTGVDELTQAAYLTAGLKLLEQDPWVEVAFWYNVRNNYWQRDADEVEARFGLLHSDFSPKPAYAAFQAYARNGAATAPASAPPAPTGLRVTLSRRGAKVSWTAVADARITGYAISLGGTRIGTTTLTSFSVPNLACGRTFTPTVTGLLATGGETLRATSTGRTARCKSARAAGRAVSGTRP